MICLYCNQEKPDSESSGEHVIPQSLGGNIDTNNPFKIHEVCGRCNSLVGSYVDGPFVRSWLVNLQRVSSAKKYARIDGTTTLPFQYFGPLVVLAKDGLVCDFWTGPTGDPTYHFHKPYPEEPDAMPTVGRPLGKVEVDPGFVILFLRSNNPVWHPVIVNSALAQFPEADIHLGNSKVERQGRLSNVPEARMSLRDAAWKLNGEVHTVPVVQHLDYSFRFQCKLALGFGFLMLGERFKSSASAVRLRNGLWAKNRELRANTHIKGSGPLSGRIPDELRQLLSWKYGHTMTIMNLGDSLALYSSFYGSEVAVTEISDEPDLWRGVVEEGNTFIVAPSLRAALSLRIGQYIGHICDPPRVVAELQDLERIIESLPPHPPFDI
ncbi:MAG: HNH endonuclease [Flavobacteriales bacterium]